MDKSFSFTTAYKNKKKQERFCKTKLSWLRIINLLQSLFVIHNLWLFLNSFFRCNTCIVHQSHPGVNPNEFFFFIKRRFFPFFAIKLGHFNVQYFPMLHTFKLNNKNMKMKKSKFCRIDSWTIIKGWMDDYVLHLQYLLLNSLYHETTYYVFHLQYLLLNSPYHQTTHGTVLSAVYFYRSNYYLSTPWIYIMGQSFLDWLCLMNNR